MLGVLQRMLGVGMSAWLLVGGACQVAPDRFRTRSLNEFSIEYRDPIRMKVSGTGCALELPTAIQLSRNTAQYNLRTILGNEQYLVSFEEIDRYETGGQVCVETEAESRAP